MSDLRVIVDCAGAAMGGAANFLRELDAARNLGAISVDVVGRGRSLSPRWIVEREVLVPRSAHRIALNNVSFIRGRGRRTVLLRNALHFATALEMAAAGHVESRAWRAQTAVVRAAARRADRVVVPCTAMGERVTDFVPAVADRIEVRPHPVSTAAWADSDGQDQILVPVLAAPYKQMHRHVARLLEVTEGRDTRIVVTGSAAEYANVAGHERLLLVGRLPVAELDKYWAESAAVYFPTTLESFGYPLAQARANGRRVISPKNSQTQEIAGRALAGFESGDSVSLAEAVDEALSVPVAPDRSSFNPTEYFRWLFEEGEK